MSKSFSRSTIDLRQSRSSSFCPASFVRTADTALGVAIDPYIEGVPFVTFSPAVIMTTLISGFGAGVFCVV